jgi:transketolase
LNHLTDDIVPPSREYGRASWLREGGEVTLVTYGAMSSRVVTAADSLRHEGVRARVLHCSTLRPFDEKMVLAAASESKLLVTIEDHFGVGGLASIVAEAMVKSGIRCPVAQIHFQDRWFRPGLLDDVLAHEGMTAEGITRRVIEEWRKVR